MDISFISQNTREVICEEYSAEESASVLSSSHLLYVL